MAQYLLKDDCSTNSKLPAWMSLYGYPEVCEDSSSLAAFARASEWLSYCVEHDEVCKPPGSFVPRRLIDVGNKEKEPFLVEATERNEPLTYACLSYCWGPDTDDILQTTKETLDGHLSSIPINDMPKSVGDAVVVCRELGIPYLWVDSLCILQHGSDDEWLEDAAKMDLTYLKAQLTIVALEPASCKQGFLGPQLYSRERLTLEDVKGGQWGEKSFSLNSRGWCLQEEILPNRRLCSSGDEMSWECLCRMMCECGHQLWPDRNRHIMSDEFDFSELGAFLKTSICRAIFQQRAEEACKRYPKTESRKLGWLSGMDDEGCSSTMTRTHQIWRQLVIRYSQRALSYRRDRLAAVAGLARLTLDAIAREDDSPDEYLAGIWRNEIHFDLAWLVKHPPSRMHNAARYSNTQKEYCAPSWSWAASDGPVLYECCEPLWTWPIDIQAYTKCELIRADCVPRLEGKEGRAGPVKEGSRIQLKGALTAVELGILETEGGFTELKKLLVGKFRRTSVGSKSYNSNALIRAQNLHSVDVVMDTPMDPNIKLDDQRRFCWLKGKCEGGCCSWDDNKKETQFYCFRLFSWRGYREETWFLLLKKSSSGVFQRIGAGKQNLPLTWMRSKRDRSVFEDAREETIDIV